MKLTIDASVLVAAFLEDEASHADASRLLQDVISWRHSVSNPYTVLTETAGAIRRRTREEKAKKALGFLRDIPTIRWDRTIREDSPERAIRAGLRGMDAVVVAHAAAAGTSLVTLDGEILERSKEHVEVLTPDRVPS